MKYSGPMGFPRLTDIGPLTYSATMDGPNEIEEELLDIIDEFDIDTNNPSQEEIDFMAAELGNRAFPGDSEEAQIDRAIFIECMQSSWSDKWRNGFTQVTTEESSVFEDLIMEVNGCIGIAESRSIQVLL